MRKKRSVTWRTAMVLHRVLKTGQKLTARDIRDRIDGQDGAAARYISPAARWLRDHGIAVGTVKRGPLTIWYQPITGQEMDQYGDQIVRESYSELRANARSCATLSGRGSRKAKDRLVRAATGLGEYLGLTVEEVVEDCKPIPIRNGSAG